MFRHARTFAFATLAATAVLACSQGDIPVGATSSSQELQKKTDGGATGNGATCSFTGVAYPVTGSTGTTSSDGTTTPPSDNVGVATEPPGGYPVGSTFPAPDNCHTCKCAADGIWCSVGACDSPSGTGQSPPPSGGSGGSGAGCDVDGKHYAEGAQFPSADGCNTCSCSNGFAACTERACFAGCLYNNNVYQPGDSFKSTDGCNTCSCQSGGAVLCTKLACAP